MTTIEHWLALHCSSEQKSLPKIDAELAKRHLAQFSGWQLGPKGWLQRHFDFTSYIDAARLVLDLAQLACDENHHPDVKLRYVGRGRGRLTLEIWTHNQGALTDNDFILAAKVDRLVEHSGLATDSEKERK